jgi:Fic family protein
VLYEVPQLDEKERSVLGMVMALHAGLKYAVDQPTRWKGMLRRHAMAKAIQGSNTIEGLYVTVDDAIAAVNQEEPFSAETTEEAWMATLGYRNALTYVQQLRNDPHFAYEPSLVRSLHFMMIWYDLSKNPGRWRPGPISVRDDSTGEIVYLGPEAAEVPRHIDELLKWLREDTSDPIVRAAVAHMNLAKIHPFSDGNGRMARCLQTLVLSRETAFVEPFSSIEEFLGNKRNTPDYYAILKQMDAREWKPSTVGREWMRFMLRAHFIQATTHRRRVTATEMIWSAIQNELSRRRLPERADVPLVSAALGIRLRNSTYRTEAGVEYDVAGRDLKLLVEADLLKPIGEKRGRTYEASERLAKLAKDSVRDKLGPISDPFELLESGGQQQLF